MRRAPPSPPGDTAVSTGLSDRIAGGALVLLGLAVGGEATTFDVYFMTDPVGPKALPMASALLFVGAGSWLLVRPGAATVWASRPVLGKMAAAVAAFGAYAALLEPLGFVVATSATLAAISTLFGGPWRKSLGSATALSVVLWYLFVWVLALPLPLGLVWEALWMP